MGNLNPWGYAIPILIVVVILWVSPKSYLNVNPKWIFSERDTTLATIDSIKVVYGMRGSGRNQIIYYSFNYNNEKYGDTYKATNFNSGPMNIEDKIKIEFLKSDPGLNKILGYIKKHRQKPKNFPLKSYGN